MLLDSNKKYKNVYLEKLCLIVNQWVNVGTKKICHIRDKGL